MQAIVQIESEAQIMAARELLYEFTGWAFTLTAKSASAPTFEGLDEELKSLPGIYAPPAGRLLLAMVDEKPAGCVCLKPHDATTCELKRLYVRPGFRGQNIGLQLVERLMQEARTIGYQRMVLDSHVSMKKAHEIYEGLGFKRVPTPDDFPEDVKASVVFMECDLST